MEDFPFMTVAMAVPLVGAVAAGLTPRSQAELARRIALIASLLTLGVVLLAATLLYVVPRTAVLGAVLLTGYLGGAVATHVRVWNPLFSHVLFPIYIGAMLWAGLWLRDARVRALLPLRSDTAPRG